MKRAFTLIELSIVLIIIGLLVGGVLVGRDLIEAAEDRAVISDYRSYMIAHQLYKDKYKAIAGDHDEAETFFGAGNTNNGGGNGILEQASVNREVWLYWQHLALADMIPGEYTGTHESGLTQGAEIGINCPATSRSEVGFSVHVPNSNGYGPDQSRNVIVVGADNAANVVTLGGWIDVARVYSLDKKFDDAVGSTGFLRTRQGDATLATVGCTEGTAPNYDYDIDNAGALCNILFEFNP